MVVYMAPPPATQTGLCSAKEVCARPAVVLDLSVKVSPFSRLPKDLALTSG
jgi:hypothetical protein